MADVEVPDVEFPDAQMADATPVPLSFPAILRNSGLSDRFAHLHIPPQDSSQPRQHWVKKERPEREGKRWLRRRENAKFTHNPHVTPPTTVDFVQPLQLPSSTFPHPLPACLPRSLLVPPAHPPPRLPSSAGLFSLSLRGVRRTLRARPYAAQLVKAIETHLATWLQGGTFLNPDQAKDLLCFPGDPVGGRDDIREVGREAGRLVWAVKAGLGNQDGGFERYVVHCVARWYGVVSFSKEIDGHRLTYLLRPNMTRPDPRINATSGIPDTPPTTDVSDVHVSDASLSDLNTTDTSDIDSVANDLPTHPRSLSDIEESRPSSPDSWSVLGGSEFVIDSQTDADDPGFAASMESLSLSNPAAALLADTTLTPSCLRNTTQSEHQVADVESEARGNPTPLRARVDRDYLRRLYPRSASSPSPARRSPYRTRKLGAGQKRKAKNIKRGFAGAVETDKESFYDYLFA